TFTASAPGALSRAHTFAGNGVYTVTQTITDNDGGSDVQTFQVYVGTVVRNTRDSGPGSLRDVIALANAHPGPDTVTFAIPANDPGHVYYKNDGVAGHVSPANVATITATDDSQIADIDPDWAHSWWRIQPASKLPVIIDSVTIDGYRQGQGTPQAAVPN